MLPSSNKNDNFRITKTGWLLNESEAIIAPPGQFCLEAFSTHNYQVLPVVCSPEQMENEQLGGNMFYTIGMFLSLPFLFSTFLVYALIRELRNLHGKSLMCHVATLLVAYTSLITVQFITNSVIKEWCVFLGKSIFLLYL